MVKYDHANIILRNTFFCVLNRILFNKTSKGTRRHVQRTIPIMNLDSTVPSTRLQYIKSVVGKFSRRSRARDRIVDGAIVIICSY